MARGPKLVAYHHPQQLIAGQPTGYRRQVKIKDARITGSVAHLPLLRATLYSAPDLFRTPLFVYTITAIFRKAAAPPSHHQSVTSDSLIDLAYEPASRLR